MTNRRPSGRWTAFHTIDRRLMSAEFQSLFTGRAPQKGTTFVTKKRARPIGRRAHREGDRPKCRTLTARRYRLSTHRCSVRDNFSRFRGTGVPIQPSAVFRIYTESVFVHQIAAPDIEPNEVGPWTEFPLDDLGRRRCGGPHVSAARVYRDCAQRLVN